MASYAIQNINVDVLEDCASKLEECSSNFLSSHEDYRNSYLFRSKNETLLPMINKLDMIYEQMDRSYENMVDWWKEYNTNAASTDNAIGQLPANFTKENLSSFTSQNFPSLRKYELIFTDTIKSNYENPTTYTHKTEASMTLKGTDDVTKQVEEVFENQGSKLEKEVTTTTTNLDLNNIALVTLSNRPINEIKNDMSMLDPLLSVKTKTVVPTSLPTFSALDYRTLLETTYKQTNTIQMADTIALASTASFATTEIKQTANQEVAFKIKKEKKEEPVVDTGFFRQMADAYAAIEKQGGLIGGIAGFYHMTFSGLADLSYSSAAVRQVENVVEDGLMSTVKFANNTVSKVDELYNASVKVVEEAKEEFKETISEVKDTAVDIATDIYENTVSLAQDGVEKAFGALQNLKETVKTGIDYLGESISALSQSASEKFSSLFHASGSQFTYEPRDLSEYKELLTEEEYQRLLQIDQAQGEEIALEKNVIDSLEKDIEDADEKLKQFMASGLFVYLPDDYDVYLDQQLDWEKIEAGYSEEKYLELKAKNELEKQGYREMFNTKFKEVMDSLGGDSRFSTYDECISYIEEKQAILTELKTVLYNREQLFKLLPSEFIKESKGYQNYDFQEVYHYPTDYASFKKMEAAYNEYLTLEQNIDMDPFGTQKESLKAVLGLENVGDFPELYATYFMSEEDRKAYFYMKDTNPALANQFLEGMQDSINQARGGQEALIFLNTLDDSAASNFFKTFGQGTKDGVVTFCDGLVNLVSADGIRSAEEYKRAIILQALNENSNYKKYLPTTYQFSNSFGNMLPSIATSALVTLVATPAGGAAALEGTAAAGAVSAETLGKAIGVTLMGLSAAGNATEGAMQQGHSAFESYTYGIFNGISEGAMEYLLGSIPGLGRLEGFTLGRILSEGIEEGTQEIVDSALKSSILGEEIPFAEMPENVFKSALMGMAMSAFLNGGNTMIQYGGRTVSVSLEVINNAANGTKESFLSTIESLPTVDAMTQINSTIDFANQYRLSDRNWSNPFLNDLAQEYDEIGTIDLELGKQLEEMFFNEENVIGIHRCGLAQGNEILETGLRLSGHLSSGVITNEIDLTQNISFFPKTESGYLTFIASLLTANNYKTVTGEADALIVNIPRSEVVIDGNLESIHFINEQEAIINQNGTPTLDSKYLEGSIHNDHGSLSEMISNPSVETSSNLYDARTMELSSDPEIRAVQQKIANGEELPLADKIKIRDSVVTQLGDYELKPDHVYRVIEERAYQDLLKTGYVTSEEGNHVHWYLGGAAARRYGANGKAAPRIILECPAEQNYFHLYDHEIVVDKPNVRHMLSENGENAVPISKISNVITIYKGEINISSMDSILANQNVTHANAETLASAIQADLQTDFGQKIVTIFEDIQTNPNVSESVKQIIDHLQAIREKYGTFSIQADPYNVNTAFLSSQEDPRIIIAEDGMTSNIVCHELGHALLAMFGELSDGNFNLHQTAEIEMSLQNAKEHVLANENLVESENALASQNRTNALHEVVESYNKIRESENSKTISEVEKLYEAHDFEALKKIITQGVFARNAGPAIQKMLNEANLDYTTNMDEIIQNKDLVLEIAKKYHNIETQYANLNNMVSDFEYYGDNKKIISMLSSVIGGFDYIKSDGSTMPLEYGHSQSYYNQKKTNSYNELFADFFTLHANGRVEALNRFREIVGDNLYNTLENQLKTIADGMKNNSSTHVINPLDSNPNIEVRDVSKVVISEDGINMSRLYHPLKAFEGYDTVYKITGNFEESFRQVIEVNDPTKNNVIEIENTTHLTREMIESLPDNMKVRITGGYTNEYLQSMSSASAEATNVRIFYTKEELAQILTELEKFESGINPEWSDYQKARYAYEYLRDNIKYNASPPGGSELRGRNFETLTSLLEKESTCQGFAQTYKELMDRMGIACTTLGSKGHAFTVVEIEGKRFVVDNVREFLPGHENGFGYRAEGKMYRARNNSELLENLIDNTELLDYLVMDPVTELNYEKQSLITTVLSTLESNISRYIYINTDMVPGLNEQILENGLYHFTEHADEILESHVINPSNMIDSYGKPKVFFFSKEPTAGEFLSNLDSLPLKVEAVHAFPLYDVIQDPRMQIRLYDDKAISHEGAYQLDAFAKKEYFGLTIKEGELVYQKITKDIYDRYENMSATKEIQDYISSKQNLNKIKGEYYYKLASKNTNAILSTVQTEGRSLLEKLNIVDPLPKTAEELQAIEKLHAFDSKVNQEIAEYYEKFTKRGFFGVAQNSIERLSTYHYHGLDYTVDEMRDIINQAINDGKPLPRFKKMMTDEYQKLHSYLIEKGFSEKDATIILKNIDTVGACSYADLANQVFVEFRNQPEKFKEYFGYDFYKEGTDVLNSEKLLLDMFLYANDIENGGKLFQNGELNPYAFFSKRTVLSRTEKFGNGDLQVYMTDSSGVATSILNGFLKSQNKHLSAESKVMLSNDGEKLTDLEIAAIQKDLKQYLEENGGSFSLSFYRSDKHVIHMISKQKGVSNTNTRVWKEGEGHAVAVTKVCENGLEVSSWGNKYYISYKDLLKGGHMVLSHIKIKIE